MRIAIVCYPSAGGSGVVATELGLALARRGHEIHFVSSSPPLRLAGATEPHFFHQVQGLPYPLFEFPPYTIALASQLHEVACEFQVDIFHAHYAIPHAVAAILAREMACTPKPKVVTTLHGTDVTLVGIDPSYLPATQYSINQSDAVTAVSHYLADYTREEMHIDRDMAVIYNSVQAQRFRRDPNQGLRDFFARPSEKIITHISNFRPVKRPGDVVRIFAQVHKQVPSRLLMVGDGPERHVAHQLAVELKVADRCSFIGSQPNVVPILSVSDLFLLPSTKESFGLSALEAMAAEVPVVASRIGGLPEVIEDGVSGLLCPAEDLDAFVRAALRILTNPELAAALGQAARRRAETAFSEEGIVAQYEAVYEHVLAGTAQRGM